MTPAPARRTLVALAAAAALLPGAPAVAQTAPPAPAPTATPAPAQPQLAVDATVIDVGSTHRLTVTGRPGATVQLFGNGRQIRAATIPAGGQVAWTLQPGDRTTFSAVVDGVRSETATVRVRRTVTIGIRQDTRGIYTFSGQVERAEAGVQVTIARLDGETGRVSGVASTRTTADGRYELRTSLPLGLSGYYALTGVTATPLEAGRSRLYGLLVNTRPGPSAGSSISLGVRRLGEYHVFSGTVTGGPDTPVTLARLVDGRLVPVVGGRTNSTGGYSLSVPLAPGTAYFQVLTATARSRVYGVVVPAAAPGTACSATAPRTSYADSARCLYQAFVRGDRQMAANYAWPAAAGELLSWRSGTRDPGWSWEGCEEPTVLTPSSGVSCAYYEPAGSAVHGVLIEFGMARDLRVEEIGTVG